jgi:hypothetical protein
MQSRNDDSLTTRQERQQNEAARPRKPCLEGLAARMKRQLSQQEGSPEGDKDDSR